MKTAAVILLAGGLAGCNPAITAPSDVVPPGTHQSSLTAIAGVGRGGVSVTPKSIPERFMAVDISVVVSNARPNTRYVVQRAPDVGRDLQSDGICQRAAALPPWSANDPPAPSFLTFPLGSATAVLTTGSDGVGNLNFEFLAPTIPAGTRFDVAFRLVDNETAPTAELRSGCFTVVVI